MKKKPSFKLKDHERQIPRRKPTDAEVNAALFTYWKRDNEFATENDGNRIARVRVLVDRVWSKVQDIALAMRLNDVKMMRRALSRRVDLKYDVGVEDVLQDVWDIVDAMEMANKTGKKVKCG